MILYPPLLRRGITLCPSLILIPQWAKGNKPYHAHEQCHAQQMRDCGVIVFWWRYLSDKAFRQYAEVGAYKVQIAAGADAHTCAQNLACGYGLDISTEHAARLLVS